MSIVRTIHAGVFVVLSLQGCDSPGVAGIGSFDEGTCVLPSPSERDDRLRFSHVVRLGSEGVNPPPGFLTPSATLSRIVRDARGRYWVGQDVEVKVFNLDGEFVATVGRAGEGPMEFGRAHPFHIDKAGRVHVFDQFNNRVSVIDDDFQLVRDSRIPALPVDMVPLEGDDRYVFAAWMPSADRIGLPLHLVENGELGGSFGMISGRDSVVDRYVADKRLTSGSASVVYSAPYWEYAIEAWAEGGSRTGKLVGTTLDDGHRTSSGLWSLDNPPWNRIRDIKIDAMGRLWVIVQIRQPDWEEHVSEEITPSGLVSLVMPMDDPAAIYQSRIDVLDPGECKLLASRWFENEGVLSGFVDGEAEMAVLEYFSGSLGDPLINIWNLSLR